MQNFLAPWAPRLPGLASSILVLVLAWLLAQLIWALVPTPAQARWQAAPAVSGKVATTASRVHLPDAGLDDLFGQAMASAADNPQQAAERHALATAPETHLNLKLLGILANRALPQQSRALIKPGNASERPYALGQAITTGVLLKAIFPNRVVLARSGKLETLRLESNKGSSSGANDVPIAVAGQASGKARKLSAIRSKLLANPSTAARYIRVQPVKAAGGVQVGYRIYPGPNHAAFKATGLHPGDIVTAINGVPLTKPAQTLQLLSELSRARQVTISVKRGSKRLTTTVHFAH